MAWELIALLTQFLASHRPEYPEIKPIINVCKLHQVFVVAQITSI